MKKTALPKVAYFCMEYGLHTDFKLYAGGLGILAGDYLKISKELNLPLIGIGILWKQGYVEQFIENNGFLYDAYHNYKYDFLKDTGIKVKVRIRNHDVYCKVWMVDCFNNAPLYLLDTDIPENEDRWITGQLYGWFNEERVAQEMVLGIGGIKALRSLGLKVDVYHFNEGHAVFAALELIREKMEYKSMDFKKAWKETIKEIVFTTHTPVIEGNESHSLELLMYMGANNGLTIEQMSEIGGVPFNMTIAGLRLSRAANAVSKLHGKTANKMWKHIKKRAPIISITNGIDRKTWVDKRIETAYLKGEKLLQTHNILKKELIEFIYKRTGIILNEEKLLIGSSRRIVPYKRNDLIFTDEKIIGGYLDSGKIQIVLSGKGHPLDDAGKKILENIIILTKKYPNSVVFLENYDMTIGKFLTRGSDVWLNTPRRPKEACGTSGMKAAMNGVLNLSILDGWWAEACIDGINGWQFGNGFESNKIEKLDKNDVDSLYDVLTKKVLPLYYTDKSKWEAMMKESIKTTYDKFSADRMIMEYYDLMY
ncbi:alpha-glucan family phosphorylase [Aceticella autotrophica]|uniref:glycogen phosphorylase n=1 Tax=Aceticella autotrophica TaxID=2755338 RepID=A0A975AXB6_9THEO|nr:alpha-glucan family phosphorylase [Aceticella autotrophica]QSZ28098.1 alpha-glucan family phosphorylase [Aceticella autotrophica]